MGGIVERPGRGRSLVVAAAAACVVALVGCARAERATRSVATIEVVDAYAVEPVTGDVAAVYLTIRNHGSMADTLAGAQTPIAAMCELHRMGGMGAAQMREQAEEEVPAGGQLQLRPGGMHLMLMRLNRIPHVGDTVDLTLRLRHAGEIALRLPVVSYLEAGERAAVGTPDDTQ